MASWCLVAESGYQTGTEGSISCDCRSDIGRTRECCRAGLATGKHKRTDYKARFPLPELTARVNGPSWRVMETGHPSTRVVETGLNSNWRCNVIIILIHLSLTTMVQWHGGVTVQNRNCTVHITQVRLSVEALLDAFIRQVSCTPLPLSVHQAAYLLATQGLWYSAAGKAIAGREGGLVYSL